MSEFSLIEILRRRCAFAGSNVALGIGDDAALLDVPTGQQLVACTDTLVAGVHFPHDTAPDDIGWKSLAVNLSDLVAMGAEPAWALLALTLPEADARFVERFADGFAELAGRHGVALIGGDTTQGPLTITVTALGLVPRGQALTRTGAKAGDAVFITGTLGDAAGALQLLRDPEKQPPHPALRARPTAASPQRGEGNAGSRATRYDVLNEAGTRDPEKHRACCGLLARLNRPEPRISAGIALRGLASACIDVSDGLIADLGHVCESSGVGAEIEIEALPLSGELRESFDEKSCRGFALAGGDDYELCFTAPLDCAVKLETDFAKPGLRATRIGRIVERAGVRVLDANGNEIDMLHTGWEHFAG